MFLGMFTKHLLKANNWLCHPSGHMEQLGCHWKGFMKFCTFFYIKFKFLSNWTEIEGIVHEDSCKFISHFVLGWG